MLRKSREVEWLERGRAYGLRPFRQLYYESNMVAWTIREVVRSWKEDMTIMRMGPGARLEEKR